MLALYYFPVAAALVTLILTAAILTSKLSKKVTDIPNERSLHEKPIPRIGGLGLMAGVLVGWGLTWQLWVLPIVVGVLFLMLISFLDDLRELSASLRLLIHFIVASAVIGMTIFPSSGWIMGGIFAIAMVWMTNLYNFMDGSDGLAGGMALFGFSAYGLAAGMSGDTIFAILNACIAASALAFLMFNFHPARIFMGDSGSIPLGFLVAALGLMGWVKGIWPLWFPPLVFAPFAVDATVTLIKRAVAGEQIWRAHRSHYYQRLILMGLGHRVTALAEYALMIVTGAMSIYMLTQPIYSQILWIFILGGVYGVLMVLIDVSWRQFQKLQQSN